MPTLPFPVYVTINGSDRFVAEELSAYEGGYRFRPNNTVYLDLAVFYNRYDSLQTTEPHAPVLELPSYILLPNSLANNMRGKSHGGTIALNWKLASDFRLRFHYSYLDLRLATRAGSQDVNAVNIAGNSPRHQFSMFSFVDFLEYFSLYAAVRYVHDLPSLGVEDYRALDLSLRWRPSQKFTASLTGQNLNDSGHLEFGAGTTEAERAIFLKLAWNL